MTSVLGYDPGSMISGLALQVDDEPRWINAWRPSRQSLPLEDRLVEFDDYSNAVVAMLQPDIVTIEVIRVGTSHDVTRVLSRFEGAMILNARRNGARVIEYQVGQSRAAFFGEGLGTLQKQQAYAAMRARYPHLEWLPADKNRQGDEKGGGLDQADALVPALAWREIEARKVVIAAEKKAKNARKRASKT